MKKDVLFFLWSGLVVILAWVIFTVIHAFTQTTISDTTEQQISPIQPVFDLQTIVAIKQRDNVIPQYLVPSATKSANLTPNQISGLAIPVASPSGQTATIGGIIK